MLSFHFSMSFNRIIMMKRNKWTTNNYLSLKINLLEIIPFQIIFISIKFLNMKFVWKEYQWQFSIFFIWSIEIQKINLFENWFVSIHFSNQIILCCLKKVIWKKFKIIYVFLFFFKFFKIFCWKKSNFFFFFKKCYLLFLYSKIIGINYLIFRDYWG